MNVVPAWEAETEVAGVVPIDTFEDKVVALYFHQPDDPDSVTEELKLAYEEFAMKRKLFEVVLVYIREPCQRYGNDLVLKSEESFWKEFKTMPWLALPFKDMSYKKLKRIFEFKNYGGHALVIFGPHAEYIEPFGCSMLLNYGIRAFPFTGKTMGEMEIEKLKELNLGKLWNQNNIFRRNDGSQDGRVVRKTLHAELEDMKFPFFAGVIEEKMFSPLSTSRQEDYYREVFRYNGRIYR